MAAAQIIDFPLSPGEDVLARVRLARDLLEEVRWDLVSVGSGDLAGIAAEMAGVAAAAEAARVAVVLEASERGVIGASDHPRPQRWVEQSCREAGVPVARGVARQVHEVVLTCAGPDARVIREAVVSGRLPVETGGLVAKIYRRLRTSIEHPHWDELAEIIVDWAASGASPLELRRMEDRLIGQYGTAGQLDERHERAHRMRDFTGFRLDRSGMAVATLRLDPASEAVVTAAIDALAAPRPVRDETGHLVQADDRTPGQRRADALVTLAGHAASILPGAVGGVPGVGVKARVAVTVTLDELRNESGAAGTSLGQALSPAEARMLACDAEITPAVLGSTSELLDLGRATRLVTPAQRTALHLRDRGCTYPGCPAPPGWCDGHHITHWAENGPTDLSNLALLCRHHHTVVHRHRHTGTVEATGVRWTRADGTPIGNRPRWGTGTVVSRR